MRSTEHNRHHIRTRSARPVVLLVLLIVALASPLSGRAAGATARVLAVDGFDRVTEQGWDAGADGPAYAYPAGPDGFRTDGAKGTITLSATDGTRVVVLDGLSRRDIDVRYRVTLDGTPAGTAVHLATTLRRTETAELRTHLRVRADGRVVVGVARVRGGAVTPLGVTRLLPDLTIRADTAFIVRSRVVGVHPTIVGLKVWPAGTTQPTRWSIVRRDGTDELTDRGTVGLRVNVPSTTAPDPITVRFDDLRVRTAVPRTAPAPTATPTSTPTSTGTSTAEPGPQTLTEVGHTVAADRFERVVDTGWGDPVAGDAYAVSGSNADFSVDGTSGIVRMTRGATRAATAIAARARDVEIRFQVRVDRLPEGGSVYAYGIARRTKQGAEYRMKLRIAPSGAVFVQATRRVDGTEQDIGNEVRVAGLTAHAGRELVLRARLTGARPTVIRMKAWPAGEAQPKAWPYVRADSQAGLQTAGTVGVMGHVGSGVSNGPITYAFDDLSVVVAAKDAVPAPTAEPTAEPTATPAPTAPTTAEPTPEPTRTPKPTAEPTPEPTPEPTATPAPTAPPTAEPTATPTLDPERTYHVSTTGSDSAAGTRAAPWLTLQKAADTVPPGALVIVRAGTYAGFTVRRSGTQGDPTIYRGDPDGARPVLDGAIGGRVDVVKLTGVHDVRIEGFEITGSTGGNYVGAGVRTDSDATRVAIVDNLIHDNRSYGILSHSSTAIIIRGNDIHGNEQGIEIRYAGDGTRIIDNRIHHQDRMLRNTVGGNDDSGASGIGFVKSTGAVLASGNVIHGNRAASYDYTWDGGAFEIYGASNVTMTDNIVYDNENVLETGTDSGHACSGNTFAHNVAWGASTQGRAWGMFLRCGEGMLVANNTFVDVEGFVFSLGSDSATYSGRIEGLRIANNVIDVTGTGAKVYGMVTAMPDSVRINGNLVRTSGQVATMPDGRRTTSLATFTEWTGFETKGISGDPRFTDRAGRDYTLQASSPAIDAGVVIADVSDVYSGTAPDLGRYERLD